MSERLSAEERAKAILDSWVPKRQRTKTTEPERIINDIAQAIKDAEQAAADAARRRAWDLAFCEAHAPADLRVDLGTGLIMEDLPGGWQEWKDPCCAAVDAFERGRREEREPITDKSICSRGHPKACLVSKPERYDKPIGIAVGRFVTKCSACTQLEAELKPLKEALETLRCFHGESANVFSERYPELAREFYAADNDEPLTRVAEGALCRNRSG